MKLTSIYRFVRWELIKVERSILEIYDKNTWKPKRRIDFDHLMNDLGKSKDFFFIQIGANDGLTGDTLNQYIKKFKWTGILVEPVPYVFEMLKINYKDFGNLIFENIAIGIENGMLPFYSICEYNSSGIKHRELTNGYPSDHLGSFDLKTLSNHIWMLNENACNIEVINVPTITLNDLFYKHSVKNLNLLQIDAEGYDFQILNNTNFNDLKPIILIFERIHLARKEYKVLVKKLKVYGYQLFINGYDTICILKSEKQLNSN